MKFIARIILLSLFWAAFALVPVYTSGCAATQVENLRKKIPAGHAAGLNATVTTLGGWGGHITGKDIDSDGKGHLNASEYSEGVSTPWATYNLTLTDANIGGKTKVTVKPAKESTVTPVPAQP